MSEEVPSSYTELVSVLEVLPLLVREKRRRDGLSLRAAARQLGLSASTVNRVEKNEGQGDAEQGVTLSSAITILRWVGGLGGVPPG